MSLIDTIKTEFASIGHDLSAEGEAILHKHLGLASVAAHLADGVANLQGTPWVQLGEEFAGLNPALVATVVKYARAIAIDLNAATAAPEPAPAQ